MQLQSTPQQNNWLASSWERSNQAGLKQRKLPDNFRMSKSTISERRYSMSLIIEAISHSVLPIFNQMFARTKSRLILSDTEGVIVESWGQSQFGERLTSIALETGVCWQEKLKGTNAIGTAIVEQKPISIIGDQHYINQHKFISCSACPIFNSNNQLVGVLDITSEQQVHSSDTKWMIQNMVQRIENFLLTHSENAHTIVNFATDDSLLESDWQGLIVADKHGEIIARNKHAIHMFEDSSASSILGSELSDVLSRQSNQHKLAYKIIDGKSKSKPSILRSKGATTEHIQTEKPLHYGEPQVELAWKQASKIINKGIALLILGETGVGKGEFVKQLHNANTKSNTPFVSVNCGAIPKNLIESELFGYEAGAFTGANKNGYKGKIRQADGGTLFLDEIGDMPLEAQTRLLHVLQDHEVMPIGSTTSHKVALQVVAATHKPLEELVESGEFRADLYYRLNGLQIDLPALRIRKDKTQLVEAIFCRYRSNAHQTMSHDLVEQLHTHQWAGNIRELDTTIKVACLLAEDEIELNCNHLPQHLQAVSRNTTSANVSITNASIQKATSLNLEETLNEQVLAVFKETGNNVTQTAKRLGVSRNTVYRKLKQFRH